MSCSTDRYGVERCAKEIDTDSILKRYNIYPVTEQTTAYSPFRLTQGPIPPKNRVNRRSSVDVDNEELNALTKDVYISGKIPQGRRVYSFDMTSSDESSEESSDEYSNGGDSSSSESDIY